jgi:hypothetical protein
VQQHTVTAGTRAGSCPDLSSSSSDVLPLLKHAYHLKHLAQLMASFPYTRIVSKVSTPDLLSLTCGDKHWCCTTPNVHTAMPLGILSGDIPCSQPQRTHSRTAIGWCSMEPASKLFDTPTYLACHKHNFNHYNRMTVTPNIISDTIVHHM